MHQIIVLDPIELDDARKEYFVMISVGTQMNSSIVWVLFVVVNRSCHLGDNVLLCWLGHFS